MKVSLIWSFILSFSIFFCSVGQADPNQIYGKWFFEASQNGFTVQLIQDIQPEQTRFSATCSYLNWPESVSVSVIVPSQVTDTEILIKGSADAMEEKNGLKCPIHVSVGQETYEINGNIMTLTGNGQTIQFTRLQ